MGKIDIDLICTIIKVINVVETNILSTEKSNCVKWTRYIKQDSLLSVQGCVSCFWSFDNFLGLSDLIIEL